MNEVQFRIKGLCCHSDVALIETHLAQYIDPNKIKIHLIEGKLTIDTAGITLSNEALLSMIRATGFDTDYWVRDNHKKTLFQSNQQFYFTALAIIFWSLGVLSQVLIPKLTFYSLPLYAFPYLLTVLLCMVFILPRAWVALKQRKADIHLLMTIAAFGAIIIKQEMEGATVTVLFSIALLLENWSLERAREAISSLLSIAPSTAWLKQQGEIVETETDNIPIGATILVKPGERIPLDGKLSKGESFINQAPITGESNPVQKRLNSPIYAGTINGETSFEFTVTQKSKDSTLARIIQMVEDAQSRRATTQKWAEKFATVYTPIMIISSLLLAFLPPLVLNLPLVPWLYRGLILLVVACPCALVISTPVSIVSGLNRAARMGVLIKGGNYLEIPGQLSVIAFDKTGTLTKGKPSIQRIWALEGYTEEHIISIAQALSIQNKHPIAHALLKKKSEHTALPEVSAFQVVQGRGVQGIINHTTYWLGSHQWLHEKLPEIESKILHDKLLALEDEGHTISVLGTDNALCGIFSVADELREETKQTLLSLREKGIKQQVMLTGDNLGTAKAIQKTLALDEIHANLLPEDKLTWIKKAKSKNEIVAIVGDGINDAPAMAEASLSIAMGGIGSSTALETADVVLMKDDLSMLPRLITHSRRVLNIIKQNIGLSLLSKAIFIVLTLIGMTSLWMAIAVDMGVSLIVIFNGLRLLR